MSSVFKRSSSFYVPGYTQNAVLQLIIFSGVCFVMFHLTRVTMMVMGYDVSTFYAHVQANVALPALSFYTHKIWTVLTYGWFHNGFWELVSNMIWAYCFGALAQMLIGYKQVIPIYVYGLIAGGIFYELAQLIPAPSPGVGVVMGARAGLVALAAAAMTLSPRYRFYLSPTFSVPLMVVEGIFAVLMLLSTGFYLPMMLLLVGGGLTGWLYVVVLRKGYRPGEWAYDLYGSMERLVTPGSRTKRRRSKTNDRVLERIYNQQSASEKRVDDILDKINQKGYNSLSAEEKEILMRAGKEK